MWVIVIKEKSPRPLGEAAEKRGKTDVSWQHPHFCFHLIILCVCIGMRSDQQKSESSSSWMDVSCSPGNSPAYRYFFRGWGLTRNQTFFNCQPDEWYRESYWAHFGWELIGCLLLLNTKKTLKAKGVLTNWQNEDGKCVWQQHLLFHAG